MTKKVTWTRDGDQHVGTIGRHEGRITPWTGPLGFMYSHKWGASNVLKLAKDAVAEQLLALHAKDQELSDENKKLQAAFVRSLCG